MSFSQWRSLVDGSEVNPIPDSGLLHNYDPRQLSATDGESGVVRVDQQAGDNLSATGSEYLASGINGNATIRYDGVDDFHQGGFSSSVPTPFEIIFVFRVRSNAQSQRLFDGQTNTACWFNNGSGSWNIFDGTDTISGVPADTNAHIGVARFASDGELQLDTNTPVNGTDLSNTSLNGLTIGAQNNNSNHTPLDSGQFLIYDFTVSGYSRSDVVSYLQDEWGPF